MFQCVLLCHVPSFSLIGRFCKKGQNMGWVEWFQTVRRSKRCPESDSPTSKAAMYQVSAWSDQLDHLDRVHRLVLMEAQTEPYAGWVWENLTTCNFRSKKHRFVFMYHLVRPNLCITFEKNWKRKVFGRKMSMDLEKIIQLDKFSVNLGKWWLKWKLRLEGVWWSCNRLFA